MSFTSIDRRRVLRRAMSPVACSSGAEVAAEGKLLLVVEVLVVEHQHAELVHAGMDGFHFFGREQLAQVEARDDAREERAVDRIDRLDVHAGFYSVGRSLGRADHSRNSLPPCWSKCSSSTLEDWMRSTRKLR